MRIECEICGGVFNCDEEAYRRMYGHPCLRSQWKDKDRICYCKPCYENTSKFKNVAHLFPCMPSPDEYVDLEKVT